MLEGCVSPVTKVNEPLDEVRIHRIIPVRKKSRTLFERTTVIDSIVADIKNKIIAGELKDGDLLASQDELARGFGVSRASLREALSQLCLMGVVETRQGSGTFVKSASAADYMNVLSPLLTMDGASAAELLEARFFIEPPMAELAAANATDEQVEKMKTAVVGMRRAYETDDTDSFVAFDTQFHMLIAASSKNRVLMKVLEVIKNLLPMCMRRFHSAAPTRVPTSMRYHEEIYEAISRRDLAGARQGMEKHIGFLMQLNRESIPGGPIGRWADNGDSWVSGKDPES